MMMARMSSENVTLPLFNHFLSIPSCMACKTNYPGSILIGMSNLLIGRKMENLKSNSHIVHTGYSMLRKGQD